MSTAPIVRLGTRGSPLARWQADWVTAQLRQLGYQVEQILISTQGDVRTGPIGSFGGQGVFTKEIQRALLEGQVDLAVHSMKDLPTEVIDGLSVAAIPPREKVGDVLISPGGVTLEQLPAGARVGTGSMRRRAQLLHVRPDLQLIDIRGNVDTRLKKLDSGDYEAIVLAEAGLTRLGLSERILQVLPKSVMLPAVGQGALALETRTSDEATRAAVAKLDHVETHAAVVAERALLATLRGGCLAPVGAWGRVEDGALKLDAVVLSPDGRERRCGQIEGAPADAANLGRDLAERLAAEGARDLIAASRA